MESLPCSLFTLIFVIPEVLALSIIFLLNLGVCGLAGVVEEEAAEEVVALPPCAG